MLHQSQEMLSSESDPAMAVMLSQQLDLTAPHKTTPASWQPWDRVETTEAQPIVLNYL